MVDTRLEIVVHARRRVHYTPGVRILVTRFRLASVLCGATLVAVGDRGPIGCTRAFWCLRWNGYPQRLIHDTRVTLRQPPLIAAGRPSFGLHPLRTLEMRIFSFVGAFDTMAGLHATRQVHIKVRNSRGDVLCGRLQERRPHNERARVA